MYHIFIHSSADGHLGCFQVLAISNSAEMNIGVYITFGIMVFSKYMPSRGIAKSYGSSHFSFGGSKITADVIATTKLKDSYSLEGKL